VVPFGVAHVWLSSLICAHSFTQTLAKENELKRKSFAEALSHGHIVTASARRRTFAILIMLIFRVIFILAEIVETHVHYTCFYARTT
jgi:hypothetical protein